MAVSQKDWEQHVANSSVWLAKIDIDCTLDFPVKSGYIKMARSCKLKYKNMDFFSSKNTEI